MTHSTIIRTEAIKVVRLDHRTIVHVLGLAPLLVVLQLVVKQIFADLFRVAQFRLLSGFWRSEAPR